MENSSPLIHATLHRPERLTGESQTSYRHRQRISKLAARVTRLVKNHKAKPAKLMRRKLVDALGIRQAKKWLRAAKSARAQAEFERKFDAALAAPVYTGPAADAQPAQTSVVSQGGL